MAITVACACGEEYRLKDDMAGKQVRCRACGETVDVPGGKEQGGADQGDLDPAFDRDKFLLRQKALAITGEKYYVWDEQGEVLMFLERPYHTLRALGAALAGIVVLLLLGGLTGALVAGVSALKVEPLTVGVGVLGGLGSFAGMIVVIVALQAKRHLTFYRDDRKQERLLEIKQDSKFHFIRATYTVQTVEGEVLGRLEKNYLYNVFRKRWYLYGPDGQVIVTAFEDSLILSLMRRLLGPMFGVLRTNFIFARGEDADDVIGEFNRKFTLLDRYVLDLSRDRQRWLDRRLAVAVGVMLDTGERR